MNSPAASALRTPTDLVSRIIDLGSGKRVQGRPARGENEVGSQKIIEGMRVALRTRRTINVARKDIAHHAGVTPALVTYYFPERNSLIEAATLPIVQTLVAKVKACIECDGAGRQHLVQAIVVLLEYFSRDAVVIALFHTYRGSTANCALPDLLKQLDTCLKSFFERWLLENPACVYDADFLHRALMGACKSITAGRIETAELPPTDDLDHRGAAEKVCSLLLGPVSSRDSIQAATSISIENPVS